MCPVCLTTAVLIAVSATSTGGLAALAIKLSRKTDGAGEVVSNSNQRRNQDVNEHGRNSQNRIAG